MQRQLQELLLPEELRNGILSKRCIAFIGSGVSIDSYDSWSHLINLLCQRCGSQIRVSTETSAEDLLVAAQDAKDLDEPMYYQVLGEHFGRPATTASLLYDALLRLPFKSYITTNFDPLLALRARDYHCARTPMAYPHLDREAISRRTVYYIHGYIAEGSTPLPGTIVLTKREFDDAYGNSGLVDFLVPTFENDPICFVGCGLREPGLQRLFGLSMARQEERQRLAANHGRTSRPPMRHILLPRPEVIDSATRAEDPQKSDDARAQQERYYSGFNVTVVWYEATGNDHSSLRRAFDRTAGAPSPIPDYGWGGDSQNGS